MCSERWAEGNATITTDASSTIIGCAIAITASDHQRRGSGSGCAADSGRTNPDRSEPVRFPWVISFVVTVYPISELQSERLLRFARRYGTIVPFVNPLFGVLTDARRRAQEPRA